ncbi:MAG: hypothetical protein JNM17_06135 [Archangium sp.]|nr:hypothetical protein [Archangium sp.]
MNTDPWLIPLLAKLRTRPAMYLGDRTVQALGSYVYAFANGRDSLLAGSSDSDLDILRKFARWLARTETEAELKRWIHLVRERAEASHREDESVLVFFELFSAFHKAHFAKDFPSP